MKFSFKAYSILVVSLLINSCQKEISNPGLPDEISVIDPDADTFLNKVQIEDTSITYAIDNLVKQLKADSLWNKFDALYPMVGGSENSTKWNLKDPRDIDAAFRLSFHGNPVFALTGVLFPTTNDYADTHLYDSLLAFDNNSISYFSRTENKENGFDMGCDDGKAPYNIFTIYHEFSGTGYFGFNFSSTPPSTIGFFMISATATDVRSYDNGILKFQKGSPPYPIFTGSPFLIGSCKNVYSVGKRECSFATIGKALNDSDALKFSSIVNEFNHRLKR